MTPLLLPLARFEIHYELGSGRPYSDLDRFLLEAVADGASSIDDLHQLFKLKPRLLIEVLVTLARAGWVAIDVAQGGFSITTLGRAALNHPDKLPPFSMIEKATDTILMEMVSGLVVPQNEISYTNEFALRQSGAWEESGRVPAGIDSDRLDAGQVISLLRRGQDQWVRSVETPVLTARGRNWLQVRVFPEAGRVFNLTAGNGRWLLY